MFELTFRAFEISEYLRHPVIILSDEVVAHTRERVVVKRENTRTINRQFATGDDPPYGGVDDHGHALMPKFGNGHNLLITGSTHDEQGFRKTADPQAHNRLVRRIATKIERNRGLLEDVVILGPKHANCGIISFGCTSRSVEELVSDTESEVSVRSLRLRTLWPFPDRAIREFAKSVSWILVPELNLGQLVNEVRRSVGGMVDVVPLNKIGGGLMIEPEEILEAVVEYDPSNTS